jgi:hypothetical protein
MGDACAGCGVKCFIAVRDTCRAFHNQEMLIFILLNRYGRAVTGVCDDLDDRTNGGSVLGATRRVGLPTRHNAITQQHQAGIVVERSFADANPSLDALTAASSWGFLRLGRTLCFGAFRLFCLD